MKVIQSFDYLTMNVPNEGYPRKHSVTKLDIYILFILFEKFTFSNLVCYSLYSNTLNYWKRF
jgi:hypothetical protein